MDSDRGGVVSRSSRGAAGIVDDQDAAVQKKRKPAAWLEISIGTIALLSAMLLVMWAQQGPPICVASPETPRPLHLAHMADRLHLAADSASATRMANRYMVAGASAEQRQYRFAECEAVLVQGIAAAHSMSADEVRANAREKP